MKSLKSLLLHKYLINTISYFSFFGFSPSFEQIHTFFPKKIKKKALINLLDRLIKQKKLVKASLSFRRNAVTEKSSGAYINKRPAFGGTRFLTQKLIVRNDNLDYYNILNEPSLKIKNFKLKIDLYTLPQYTKKSKMSNLKCQRLFAMTLQRRKITQKKLTSIKHLIKVLQKLPLFRFVGVTGSAAMGNCKRNDDIDLFIITSKNHLFIGRFFAILFTHIYNVRKGKNSVCLNLFFNENDLLIPKQKQTTYVAHEALQIKPLININNTYERFLKVNDWIYGIFPNSRLRPRLRRDFGRASKNQIFWNNVTCYMLDVVLSPFELVLKWLQLAIIRKNKTGLIITPTQLWLFRRDFEKKIKQPIL